MERHGIRLAVEIGSHGDNAVFSAVEWLSIAPILPI
jgi:hypothetical protein